MISKLYVVGLEKDHIEKFDRTADSFSIIKLPTVEITSLDSKVEAISIGNKTAVFGRKESTILV